MECISFKIQYVGKTETTFNHRKDSKETNSILACNHNFNYIISTEHGKLIIINKLINLHGSKEALRVVIECF